MSKDIQKDLQLMREQNPGTWKEIEGYDNQEIMDKILELPREARQHWIEEFGIPIHTVDIRLTVESFRDQSPEQIFNILERAIQYSDMDSDSLVVWTVETVPQQCIKGEPNND